MKALWKDKLLLFVVAYLVTVLIAIPLTVVTLKKSQENRSIASGSAGLSFSPSPLEKNTGETFTLDVMINPGQHAVSFVTLDILYDPTKLSIDPNTGLQMNTTAFPTTLEGPIFETGRIRVKVSIGFDPTKALLTETRIGTLTFTAEAPTNTQEALVHFGETSFILSVAPSDSATENVLSTVSPALMNLSGEPTGNGGPPVTPVPTFGGPTPTIGEPTPTLSVPTPTVNVTPQPTCTPIPPECIEDDALPICQNIPPGGYCNDDTTPTLTPIGQPTPAPIACKKKTHADVMLVLDSSNSMHGERFTSTKESAKSFIKLLNSDPKNNFGVVSFDRTAKMLSRLVRDASDARRAVDEMKLAGGTCTKCGIEMADAELNLRGRPDASKIMILLTDGRANVGGSSSGREAAEIAALAAAQNAQTQNLIIYTIGIGAGVNQYFLQQLANSTNGLYYHASEPIEIDGEFKELFKRVSDDICELPDIAATAYPSLSIPSTTGQTDPANIMLILLLFLPLFLLLGHLLV